VKELLAQLDTIFDFLEKEHIEPPISDTDYRYLAGKLPFEIPTAIENIYKWHDGIERFIPNYDFMSLSGAVAEYERLIALREEFQDESFFNDSFLPIFWTDKSYLIVDCDPNYEESIYYLSFESRDLPEVYETTEQMLRIIVDAYLSRAYYIEDGSLTKNSVLLKKIESKYLSSERLNERESKWNKICDELHELEKQEQLNRDGAGEEAYAEVFGYSQTDFQKSILVNRLYMSYDERAIGYLTEFLNDSNPEIVSNAAYGLGELRAREKLPELLKLLDHPDRSVRSLATCAIGNIALSEDEILIQPLLQLLISEDSIETNIVQVNTAEALGKLTNPKAIAKLIDFLIVSLPDKESKVTPHVISALSRMGDIGVVEKLEQRKIKASPDMIKLIDKAIRDIERGYW
jgi:HEAT repeats